MAERAPNEPWSRVWRALAETRDRQLAQRPALSSERRAALHAALARALPLETALREAALQRDRALDESARAIPRAVTRQLHRCLTNYRPCHRSRTGWSWARPLPLAACLALGLGLLFSVKWDTTSGGRRAVMREREHSFVPLTLRLSARELAFRQESFLAANPASEPADLTQLRLDLPIQALLEDDGTARTP